MFFTIEGLDLFEMIVDGTGKSVTNMTKSDNADDCSRVRHDFLTCNSNQNNTNTSTTNKEEEEEESQYSKRAVVS